MMFRGGGGHGYHVVMELATPTASNDVEMKVKEAAHHEAGHLVAATVLGLSLRPEGLSIDSIGNGFAYYWKNPDETDISRERVILSTFAGWYAQKRFCELESVNLPEWPCFIFSPDSREARTVLCKLSDEYLSGRSIPAVQEELERMTASLVEKYWDSIEILADALLKKEWEALKPLKSEGHWSDQATAKYVPGDEVALILQGCGIRARCVSELLNYLLDRRSKAGNTAGARNGTSDKITSPWGQLRLGQRHRLNRGSGSAYVPDHSERVK